MILFCRAVCFGDDAQAATQQAEAGRLGERDIRLILPFEIARRHAELWESNPAAVSLVTQMMKDLIDDADLDVRWSARFLLKERRQDETDAFEQRAMVEIREAKAKRQAVWNGDGDRLLTAISARSSCVSCHAVKAGDTMGYASLRVSRRQAVEN
jgi:hypothetical protein